MKLTKETENVSLKINALIRKFYPDTKKIDFKKYLERTEMMQNLNEHQDSLVLLLDVRRFQILYIDGDLENYIGYSLDKMSENTLLNILNLLDEKSRLFPLTLYSWVLNLLNKLAPEYKQKQFIYSWGFETSHRQGRKIKSYISFTPLEIDERQNPLFVMVLLQDITHLLKSENFWIKGVFGETEKKIFVYNSAEEKTVEQDIITDREKEVLQLIAQGQDTKHIAAMLNISPNTVDNHRRNMLTRTGTRDTTALIQLCRMMGMF